MILSLNVSFDQNVFSSVTAQSKVTLQQSLYSGGVWLLWKYEQKQCFTFSTVAVTLTVIRFQVGKI